ncbi:hypothetical protein VNI00_017357 [Paramarasmius palmivorus]|uniref:Nucleolar protein n=1 Tax=Paramarasmius palmivorus TaxID=297713 RepID=A0AAW0B667_9AGAR
MSTPPSPTENSGADDNSNTPPDMDPSTQPNLPDDSPTVTPSRNAEDNLTAISISTDASLAVPGPLETHEKDSSVPEPQLGQQDDSTALDLTSTAGSGSKDPGNSTSPTSQDALNTRPIPSTPKRSVRTPFATPRSSKHVLPGISPRKTRFSPHKTLSTVSTKVKKKVGHPSNFEGKPLEFLQEKLQVYKKLKPRSKARLNFYVDVYAEFKEKFPDYQIRGRKDLPPLEVLDEEKRAKMSAEEVKEWDRSHKRKEQLRARSEEEILRDALKTWFQWHGGSVRAKDKVSVGRFLERVKINDRAPKKQQMTQVVMSHPEYKDMIKGMSKETGRDDRLPKRTKAATAFLKTLTDDQRKILEENAASKYSEAREKWKARKEGADGLEKLQVEQDMYRKSLGRIVQPFLDGLREVTGLDMALLIREDVDGQGEWDGTIFSAQEESAPKLADFDSDNLDPNFINFFYRWLQHLRSLKPSKDASQNSAQNDTQNDPQSNNSGVVEDASATIATTVSRKGKKKAKLKSLSEEESESEDSDEEISDWSSGVEDEDEEASNKGEGPASIGGAEDEVDGNLSFEEEPLLASLGLDKPIFETTSKPKRTKKARIDKTLKNETPSEESPPGEARDDQAQNEFASGVRNRLMEKRKQFINNSDGANVGNFSDLINELTVAGSETNRLWIAHVSVLSEVLEFEGSEQPEAPDVNPKDCLAGDSAGASGDDGQQEPNDVDTPKDSELPNPAELVKDVEPVTAACVALL